MRAVVVVTVASFAACASAEPRPDAPTTIAAATTATTTTPAPPPPTTATATMTATTVPALQSIAAKLSARDKARVAHTIACQAKRKCDAVLPALDLDDAAIKAAFAVRPRDVAGRAVQASLARALIDDALAVAAATERNERRRALTFKDNTAVFALDDIETLVAQAPAAADRVRLLSAAFLGGADAALRIGAERRALVDAAAARAGTSRAELIARRAGVDAVALRTLIDHAVSATAPLLQPPSPVTSLPEVARLDNAAAVSEAAKVSADPIFIRAYANVVALHAAVRTKHQKTRALIVELRRDSLAARAVLDFADIQGRDALASRVLDDDAAAIPGASLLLPMDDSGVVVERFVAALRAPQLAQSLWSGASLEDARRAWDDAPPVEQQGFPEAFVETLHVLAELAR